LEAPGGATRCLAPVGLGASGGDIFGKMMVVMLPNDAWSDKELMMQGHYIFGYGSLVNRATHDYRRAHPATLRGWRREWRATTLREVAFLNVVPSEASAIQGMILAVASSDPALAKREYAYSPHAVSQAVAHDRDDATEVNVFAIGPDTSGDDTVGYSLLLSYIDVVVQGYFREFGEAGVARFFETTDGWQAPVINDRAAPRYPRNQPQSRSLRAMTDDWLLRLSAVVK
jgi:ChaC-like protein